MIVRLAAMGLAIGLMVPAYAARQDVGMLAVPPADWPLVIAQTGPPAAAGAAAEAEKDVTPEERMNRRFPQPVRVGDLIGLPMLNRSHSTIGFVRQVVRTPQDKIELIVAYGGWFGWGARPVAVPIEVVGIMAREMLSLDMPSSAYAAASTWHETDATVLPNDASIRVALAQR